MCFTLIMDRIVAPLLELLKCLILPDEVFLPYFSDRQQIFTFRLLKFLVVCWFKIMVAKDRNHRCLREVLFECIGKHLHCFVDALLCHVLHVVRNRISRPQDQTRLKLAPQIFFQPF